MKKKTLEYTHLLQWRRHHISICIYTRNIRISIQLRYRLPHFGFTENFYIPNKDRQKKYFALHKMIFIRNLSKETSMHGKNSLNLMWKIWNYGNFYWKNETQIHRFIFQRWLTHDCTAGNRIYHIHSLQTIHAFQDSTAPSKRRKMAIKSQ